MGMTVYTNLREGHWEWIFYKRVMLLLRGKIGTASCRFYLVDDLSGFHQKRRIKNWLLRRKSHRSMLDEDISENTKGPDFLLHFSDEEYQAWKYPNRIRTIFKHYCQPGQLPSVLPLPLGCQVSSENTIPIANRKYDISFMGKFYPHRTEFCQHLKAALPKEVNLLLETGQRDQKESYATVLENTKISLCLPGRKSPESWRFFESCKMGCIPLISDKVPKNSIYNVDGPLIKNMDDIPGVAACLVELLEDTSKLEQMSQSVSRLYQQKYSEEAQASYIYSAIIDQLK